MISLAVLSISRFDPELELSPTWQSFSVRRVPAMTVQDALIQIRDEQDCSLRFREAEPGGFSGIGAVALNGRPVLPVREPLPTGDDEVRIGPLANHAVIVDLVVDSDIASNRIAQLRPWLQRTESVDLGRPTEMTREQLDRLQRSEYCNMCGICDGALRHPPSDFIGARFLLKTYRLAADTRDDFDRERMQLAVGRDGVWACNSESIVGDPCPYSLAPFAQIDKLKRSAAVNGFSDPR